VAPRNHFASFPMLGRNGDRVEVHVMVSDQVAVFHDKPRANAADPPVSPFWRQRLGCLNNLTDQRVYIHNLPPTVSNTLGQCVMFKQDANRI
jgi:hypothetical protein